MLHAIVMAGGSGTRFWPASRAALLKKALSGWFYTVSRVGGWRCWSVGRWTFGPTQRPLNFLTRVLIRAAPAAGQTSNV